MPRPQPAAGEDAPSPFDPPNFPQPVALTAKALRNAALPLAREAFSATPSDPVVAGVLMTWQLAGKGGRAGRRALRTAAVRLCCEPRRSLHCWTDAPSFPRIAFLEAGSRGAG